MNTEKKAALRQILGDEMAEQLLAQADRQTAELEVAGIAFKSLDGVDWRRGLETLGIKLPVGHKQGLGGGFYEGLIEAIRDEAGNAHPAAPYLEQIKALGKRQQPLVDLMPSRVVGHSMKSVG